MLLKVTSCKNIGSWSRKGGNLVVLSLELSLLKSEEKKISLSESILHKGYQAESTFFPRFIHFVLVLIALQARLHSYSAFCSDADTEKTSPGNHLAVLHTAAAMGLLPRPSSRSPSWGSLRRWLLQLQPWALREQPFPPELACQTKSAVNRHFKSVSMILEPPILSPLFG